MNVMRPTVVPLLLALVAAPLSAQPAPAAKPDPAIAAQVKEFKAAIKDRKGEKDADAQKLITGFAQGYKAMHKKDQKSVRDALSEVLTKGSIKRTPEHQGLYVDAITALGDMGPDGAKLLVKGYNNKKFKGREWVNVRSVFLKNIGRTKDTGQIGFLLECASRDPEDQILQAAGKALGNFADAKQEQRKKIVKELVKKFGSVYSAANKNVDPNDPQVKAGRERLTKIQDDWNATLKALTKQAFDSAPDWQRFYNKNKGKNWDKL